MLNMFEISHRLWLVWKSLSISVHCTVNDVWAKNNENFCLIKTFLFLKFFPQSTHNKLMEELLDFIRLLTSFHSQSEGSQQISTVPKKQLLSFQCSQIDTFDFLTFLRTLPTVKNLTSLVIPNFAKHNYELSFHCSFN